MHEVSPQRCQFFFVFFGSLLRIILCTYIHIINYITDFLLADAFRLTSMYEKYPPKRKLLVNERQRKDTEFSFLLPKLLCRYMYIHTGSATG